MFHVEQYVCFFVNQIKIYKSDVYQYVFVIVGFDPIIFLVIIWDYRVKHDNDRDFQYVIL